MVRGSVGGFDFSEDYDPMMEPDEGSIPEEGDTSFNIDEFEQAASVESEPAASATSEPQKTARTKITLPAPEQKNKKIPYRAYYKDVPPNKYIESYSEAQKWLEALNNEERNVIGGTKAWYSGEPTELTDAAKKVAKRLERFMGSFSSEDNEDTKSKVEVVNIPQPEAPAPSPATSTSIPSSSGSGAGIPPSQPPAPPSFPPDDYSDYPQGEPPEQPSQPSDPSEPPEITQASELPDDKKIQELINKNISSAKKQFRDFIRDEKDKFAREFRDERLALNREVQKLNREAVARKTEINRASSDAKTAIYSLSAGIGLPGYIVASVADSLVIQPAVREDVQTEKKYQEELKDYKDQVIDITNARKDAFREYVKSNEFANLPPEVKEQYAATGEIPEEAMPSFEEWAKSTGAAASFSKTPTPPTPPGPSKAGAMTSMLGKAVPIATAVVEGINITNTAYKTTGEEARTAISSSLSKDPVTALSTKVQSIAKAADPLRLIGLESPVSVGIQEGAKIFEQAVKEFQAMAKEDLGFSPEALATSVEGSIMRLEQSMKIAQEIDPQKAAIIQVTDEIGLIWNEFRALFFSTFAPIIVVALNFIKIVLTEILYIIKFIKNSLFAIADALATILTWTPTFFATGQALKAILKHLKKGPKPPSLKVQKALEDFHNPSNRPIQPPKPGNMR